MVGYAIDFLPVGDGERSGDAIALRYSENGAYTIHVVDGGTMDAGKELVAHITKHYGAPAYVDHVVCTHTDNDHSSGLRAVIDEFEVGNIWMNRPWLYAAETVHLFDDNRWTVPGLEQRLRKDFPILTEIEEMALEKGIPIHEAFQGEQVGAFTILSPSRDRYLELIPQFTRTPQAAEGTKGDLGIAKSIVEAMKAVAGWIFETWGHETLAEDVETSASNESSVVQFAEIDGRKILLAGDAGVVSLHEAADYAELYVTQLPGLRFMQVPHHGSRHNVSPSSLNRWLGEPVGDGVKRNTTAFASVAKDADTHPRRKVVNAFLRRGADVYSTKGKTICHHHNMPNRDDWVGLTSYDFFDEVEA